MSIQIYTLENSGGGRLLKEACAKLEWPTTKELVVDWRGNGLSVDSSDGILYLNPGRRINNFTQTQIFQNNSIETPVVYSRLRDAIYCSQNGFKVWGRLFEHSKGKDIVDERSGKKFVDSQYWVKVVPNIVEEWRIHIVWGRRIARGLKVQVDNPNPKIHKKRIDLPIRNRHFGWRMRHDVEPSEKVSTLAKAAVKALGYDFGAVDLYVTEDGIVGVLEANRVPGLDESSAKAYANAFHKIATGAWKRRT